MLFEYEIPIAYSMINLFQEKREKFAQPFQQFICYWIAFNNIYTTLTERKKTKHRFENNKKPLRYKANGSVNIPIIKRSYSERDEIQIAYEHFDENLKINLISHKNTSFFVNRIPKWNFQDIEFDIDHQRVNGVINIRYTINKDKPVWSPIDIPAYNRFCQKQYLKADTDLLSNQILFMLYTIRNNTFHGGKRFDDANDKQVINKSFPLLKMIVDNFLGVPYDEFE